VGPGRRDRRPVRGPVRRRRRGGAAAAGRARGGGRVGQLVAEGTRSAGRALVIIEEEPDIARQAVEDGFQVVTGHAADPHVLEEAGIADANKLVIAIPEGFEGGAIAERARKMNAELTILARAHSDDEVEHLSRLGADHVVMGEREIATRLLQMLASLRKQPAAG
jgi:monovalent cation:H+ antiporter-2, CPA2 family